MRRRRPGVNPPSPFRLRSSSYGGQAGRRRGRPVMPANAGIHVFPDAPQARRGWAGLSPAMTSEGSRQESAHRSNCYPARRVTQAGMRKRDFDPTKSRHRPPPTGRPHVGRNERHERRPEHPHGEARAEHPREKRGDAKRPERRDKFRPERPDRPQRAEPAREKPAEDTRAERRDKFRPHRPHGPDRPHRDERPERGPSRADTARTERLDDIAEQRDKWFKKHRQPRKKAWRPPVRDRDGPVILYGWHSVRAGLEHTA